MAYDVWLDMVNNKNNFSYWFERVKGCGIKMPVSVYYQFTYRDICEFIDYIYGEDAHMEETRFNFKREIVYPLVTKFTSENECDELFVKNATFSNKFEFDSCHIHNASDVFDKAETITNKLEIINYEGLLVGAEGFNEVVIREYIKPVINLGSIYYGMVLRPEFRVFYDFDAGKLLYTVNYWDYQYCKDYLYVEDKEVFANAEKQLNEYFDKYVDKVESLVSEHMSNAWFKGIWSIDIMMNDEDDFYLIDMATAETSAYWDPKKAE